MVPHIRGQPKTGHVGMKAKGMSGRDSSRVSANEQARVEMQSFVKALDSYPRSFAQNPQLSFDQHRIRLMAPTLCVQPNGKLESNGRKH